MKQEKRCNGSQDNEDNQDDKFFFRPLTPKPCSLDLTNFQDSVTYHFTGDPVGALIHSETDDGWHTHALSLVVSLLNPLGSNYLRGEQKAGARQLLLTWQLDEQHSPLFYEANLQSSRNETRSNEGKCLDRQTQTTVTQAGAEHLNMKSGGGRGQRCTSAEQWIGQGGE